MRNYSRVSRDMIVLRKRPEILGSVKLGYEHVRNGMTFCEAYNTAPRGWQNNYELGRLYACYLGGMQAPAWPKQTLPPPLCGTGA